MKHYEMKFETIFKNNYNTAELYGQCDQKKFKIWQFEFCRYAYWENFKCTIYKAIELTRKMLLDDSLACYHAEEIGFIISSTLNYYLNKSCGHLNILFGGNADYITQHNLRPLLEFIPRKRVHCYTGDKMTIAAQDYYDIIYLASEGDEKQQLKLFVQAMLGLKAGGICIVKKTDCYAELLKKYIAAKPECIVGQIIMLEKNRDIYAIIEAILPIRINYQAIYDDLVILKQHIWDLANSRQANILAAAYPMLSDLDMVMNSKDNFIDSDIKAVYYYISDKFMELKFLLDNNLEEAFKRCLTEINNNMELLLDKLMNERIRRINDYLFDD